jgi:hypothetical protein
MTLPKALHKADPDRVLMTSFERRNDGEHIRLTEVAGLKQPVGIGVSLTRVT